MHKKNYGRGGDTEIRKIKGKDSHVSAFESYLIDTLKDKGEDMVLSFVDDPNSVYGSGTINPNTGLKEYFLDRLKDSWNKYVKDPISGFYDAVTDDGFQLDDLRELDASVLDPRVAWDHTLGKHGLGGWLSGAGDEKAFSFDKDKDYYEKQSATRAIDSGISSIKDTLDSNLGEGGFLDQTRDKELQKGSMVANQGFQKAQSTADQMITKSGCATNTNVNRIRDLAQADTMAEYTMGRDSAFMEREKGEIDLLNKMNQQYNQLLMDYKNATDEEYKTNELDDYFG